MTNERLPTAGPLSPTSRGWIRIPASGLRRGFRNLAMSAFAPPTVIANRVALAMFLTVLTAVGTPWGSYVDGRSRAAGQEPRVAARPNAAPQAGTPQAGAPQAGTPQAGTPPAPPAAVLGPPPTIDASRAYVVPVRKPSMADTADANAIPVDDIMDQDPLLVLPGRMFIYSKSLKPLWLKALARPDADTRRLAADTFTIAVARNFPDLADAGPALVDVAVNDKDPVTRRAAARAAVALDSRSAAATLWKLSTDDGLLMAQIVEPALARWKFSDAGPVWRSRLERLDGERAYLLLAIECVAVAGDAEAVEPLLQLAGNDLAPGEIRTAAATAAGKLKDSGLSEAATAAI
ncbi:MAG: hypothetical protein ACKO38_18270, partial [Planctomycetota bacterium]